MKTCGERRRENYTGYFSTGIKERIRQTVRLWAEGGRGGVVEGARERETGTKELKKVQHLMLKGILAAGAERHPLGRAWWDEKGREWREKGKKDPMSSDASPPASPVDVHATWQSTGQGNTHTKRALLISVSFCMNGETMIPLRQLWGYISALARGLWIRWVDMRSGERPE